jgi:hypothetical protein
MSEIVAKHTKDSGEQLDYGIDYTDLLALGETIIASAWDVTPEGLTIVATTFQTPFAVVYAAGGLQGVTYTAENSITTSASPPRVIERSIRIAVR